MFRLQAAERPSGAADRKGGVADALQRIEDQYSTVMRQSLDRTPWDPAVVVNLLPGASAALSVEVDVESGQAYSVSIRDGQIDHQVARLGDQALNALLRHWQRGAEAAWDVTTAELQSLGAAVLPPALQQALVAGSVDSIIISAQGPLAVLPWSAVIARDQPLAAYASLNVCPSLGLWQALQERRRRCEPSGSGALVFVDPGLRGSALEMRALRRHYSPVVKAGRTELCNALTTASRYDLLVVSTHGSAEPGISQQLLLGDGVVVDPPLLLTARLPALVVLGACWAGRLDATPGQEPLGLAAAALAGGASTVLGGVAEIGSLATAGVLRRFYRLFATGLGPAEALRRAQLSYRRRHPRARPAEWAGLLAVGLA